MADVFSSVKRSDIMRCILGKDTKPEKVVRSILHRKGYRFRLHYKKLPGCPDIVFPSRKKIIFVHGCFWHGHNCQRGARLPKTNSDYWKTKIERNNIRFEKQLLNLNNEGWSVLTVWECEIKDIQCLERVLLVFMDDIT